MVKSNKFIVWSMRVYTTLDRSKNYAIAKTVSMIMHVNLDQENRTKSSQTGIVGTDYLDTAYLKGEISPFLQSASFSSGTDTYCRRCASHYPIFSDLFWWCCTQGKRWLRVWILVWLSIREDEACLRSGEQRVEVETEAFAYKDRRHDRCRGLNKCKQ